MAELKRCPFCGHKVAITNGVLGKLTMIVCTDYKNCGATISFDNPYANLIGETAVIKLFNTRAKEVRK